MANITVRLYVNALKRPVIFEMYYPNDFREEYVPVDNEYYKRPTKTLILLHGYTGGQSGSWVPEELCQKYNLAVIVPNGENSFYLDGISTGHMFATFVGVELIDYLRKTFNLCQRREDTFVMGLSMGGYGALHTGLFFHDTFSKVGAMSSAIIVKEVANMKEGSSNPVANYEYYRECFGEPAKLLDSDNNLEHLVKRLQEEKAEMPEVYMCCGTEDFLIENNRDFHNFLESVSFEHIYKESAGVHDMKFWNEYTEKIITWMCE